MNRGNSSSEDTFGTFDLDFELTKDQKYSNGKILSSMNSEADKSANDIFIQHLNKNLGDPALFPGTRKAERNVIEILGRLVDLPKTGTGLILTGGSEANITAIWAIRNYRMKQMDQVKNLPLEIIAPSSAHVSINKAADILGLKLISIPVTHHSYQIDLKKVRSAINSRTIAIIGVAGTTALGTVDPLLELDTICLKHSLDLHIDAAFAGLVIPFLDNKDDYSLSFQLRSLKSMTLDIHKMGRIPIPGGGLLWRDKSYPSAIEFTLPYLDGQPKQQTLSGTRLGASAIAFSYRWQKIGFRGMKKEVSQCIKNTRFLADELRNRHFTIPIEPVINILGVKIPENSIITQNDFHRKLWERGWTTTIVNGLLRLVIMPVTTKDHLKNLLKSIDNILAS
ncbi:MAG: tyrosine decarboxylase MfnA [Candidatus Heimdallarchaeota archaeon]|nr:tyrosine decarboxylase MfnA [Candidatus Heimdallarchaeota archaeon]